MVRVFAPAKHLIVPPPAWRERSLRGIESQFPRFAAGSRDDVDLLVAVVLAGESDPLAVRGEFPEDFDARYTSDAVRSRRWKARSKGRPRK